MKKAFSIVMALVLLFPILPSLNMKVQADDVTGIKLEAELRSIIEAGIMSGYEDGTFRPGNNVTREEFATFLARALELPSGPAVFKDVSPAGKLAPYINAAAAAGIIKGGSDGNFHPKATIVRKDMALMIDNALAYLNKTAEYVAPTFSDMDGLSSTHKIAIGKSVNLGIISGFPDNTFRPDANAQRDQAAAFIYRLLEGDLPEPPPAKLYQTANIDAAGNVTRSAVSYESFDLAKQAMNTSGSELVTKDGKIIYMKYNGGMVFAKPASGATVNLYTDPALKTAKTYVSANPKNASKIVYTTTELKYVTSTDQYVQVYIGGEDYYMKPDDAMLVPFEGAKGRGYYQNVNGSLVHSIYGIENNTYSSYNAGIAPSFMRSGQKYYSWDGFSFYNASGHIVGREYQYFQYLTARTTTNYTAAELDAYIKKAVAEREAMGYAKYKDASKKSKILGIGAALKKVEREKHVNALMVLAMAIHESDYGTSDHAYNNNNIFGIQVYDNNPEKGKSFETVEEGINHLADEYFTGADGDWRGGYLTPGDWRSYGAAPGTKSNGINVKYASDPFWGAKVGGHMRTIDKELGLKDFGQYTLGFTNTTDLNVRTSANGSLLYTYNLSRMPVAILQQGEWTKVVSDIPTSVEGYIYSDYINILPVAGKE
ncbi:S-layer homology domain-containing protein [Bacillus sp. 37MA]|uniref:S-layer homology domain-containing protein n=1 Tax=Bacillus sp. 37MA TaxID=1132442 RepID=UPI00036E7889|nr:S-layer homology domain-containing protein [Bacillus sp. 37MA]